MADTPVIDIIINRRSGTVLREGEAQIEKNLREIFADAAGCIRFIEGQDIAATVRQWRDDPAREGRRLMIGGGDGSVISAAEQVMNTDTRLSVLPLGTQNFVSRALGFSPDYREAAAQHKDSVEIPMDVGSINGHPFLYGAVISPAAIDLFEAREAARNKDFAGLLKKAFSCAANYFGRAGQSYTMTCPDGQSATISGRLFVVTTSPFMPRSNLGQGLWKPGRANFLKFFGNAFARAEQGGGQLALYAHKGGVTASARIVGKLWDGSWHKDEDIMLRQLAGFTLFPAPGQKQLSEIAVNLDGENKILQFPLTAAIHPNALKISRNSALVPNI